ncbi:MAG: SRPBCC family protein [Bdellovibrionota bacterium]|nr:SRPBCC family protein [Bdellovibrionota bacterium]
MFKIKVEKFVKSDIDAVFNIISDHENYTNFPGVTGSVLLEHGIEEKNGKGALRKINLGPIQFIERIIHFEPPFRMVYQIEKARPLPIIHEKGELILNSEGEGTHITWTSTGNVAIPLIGSFLLDKIFELRGSQLFEKSLSCLEKELLPDN